MKMMEKTDEQVEKAKEKLRREIKNFMDTEGPMYAS